jgi:hypothetical protein
MIPLCEIVRLGVDVALREESEFYFQEQWCIQCECSREVPCEIVLVKCTEEVF